LCSAAKARTIALPIEVFSILLPGGYCLEDCQGKYDDRYHPPNKTGGKEQRNKGGKTGDYQA
jgi:hypothetical protein